MRDLALSRAIAILACFVLVSGCASIFEGTTQQISVSTTPSGARCTFWKNGVLIGNIPSTPGALTVQKSKVDLFIVCDKPGYASSSYVNKSGLAAATFANVLTAGLSWAVDASRGADNKYEGEVNLSLAPMSSPMTIPNVPSNAMPEPASPPSATHPRPRAPGPAATPAAAPPPPPPAPQLDCVSTDGSRIRVTGAGCPSGWTAVR